MFDAAVFRRLELAVLVVGLTMVASGFSLWLSSASEMTTITHELPALSLRMEDESDLQRTLARSWDERGAEVDRLRTQLEVGNNSKAVVEEMVAALEAQRLVGERRVSQTEKLDGVVAELDVWKGRLENVERSLWWATRILMCGFLFTCGGGFFFYFWRAPS